MQFRRALATLAAIALALPALAQNVKVEKYQLDNGLTVILHEDHRLPVATINLWYRVGAKEEPRGRSGFAHLFEHLMFMGTERVPGNEFDKIMETGGGSNNASTALDRTNYFSSGPAELLPTLLWLDADRLEDLGRMMNQEKLDKQRDVVRNELRQVYENSPYGKAEIRLYQLAYPFGHPYHESVIGTHADLEAASVTNVKDFFATFYVPNNCSLVVAGDFDPAKIKPLIAQLFGTLPRGGEPPLRDPKDWPIPHLGKVVRATLLDQVELPRITFCYHSPAWYAPGDAEMRLVGDVLAAGKSSRLYKRLVMDLEIAVDVSAAPDPAVLGSLFFIHVYAKPDADLNRIEAIVDEELARVFSEGITPDELEQRKNRFELGFLSRMDSLPAVADQLNEYQFAWGEPNSFKRDLDRYRNATAESARGWAKKVLTPDSRIILRVLPETRRPSTNDEPGAREKNPGLTKAKDFTLPAPEEFTLNGGVKCLLWRRPELPLVAATLLIKPQGGGALDPADKAGLAQITSQMITEGAGDLDAIAFADAVQGLGARLSADASHESLTVDLNTVRRNLDKAANLMGLALRAPRMTQEDFDRVKRLHLEELEQSLVNPSVVASNVAARALFGEAHPYSRPTDGRVDTVGAIKLADVKAAHAVLFSPRDATLLICGDVSADEARKAFNAAFANWIANPHPRTPVHAGPAPKPASPGLRVFLVHRPEAVQTVIRFAMPGPRLADPVRTTYQTLNTLLGGSFTSRLNQNLREDHGYTYGARSGFNMAPSTGYFTAASAVRADATGAALGEFLKEFDRLRKGDVTSQEVAKAVQTRRTDTIEAYSTMAGVVGQAATWLEAGLPLTTPADDLKAEARLSPADLNAAAGPALPFERGVLVLVGDRRLVLDQIKALGLPPVSELTAEGAPVSPGQGAASGLAD